MFPTADGLLDSLARLDDLWATAVPDLDAATKPVRAREAAAMVAHARWMYRAALARTDSRAMHIRDDHPKTSLGIAHRLLVSGLDEVTVSPDPTSVGSSGSSVEELAS